MNQTSPSSGIATGGDPMTVDCLLAEELRKELDAETDQDRRILLAEQIVKANAKYAPAPIGEPLNQSEAERVSPAAAALAAAEIDLMELIRNGIPERKFVPGGSPWLISSKRYLMPAPAGTGKSVASTVIAVEVVDQGGTVVILDVENGSEEYASRLQAILEDRESTVADACAQRLRYYAWPALRADWEPDEWAAAIGDADLAIFDSSRLILSSAGLQEDSNDDYAEFVSGLLVPLSKAGIATLVLDNTGWSDEDRSRGAKSKEDLNEVVYVLKVSKPFDVDETGELRLKRRRTRFSGLPEELSIVLGGGTYRAPVAVEPDTDQEKPAFRPTGYMEKISKALEADAGLSKRAVRATVGGKTEWVDLALELLIAEKYVRPERDGTANRHYSHAPYREDRDPVTQARPNRDPVTPKSDRDPVTLPLREVTVTEHTQTTASDRDRDPDVDRAEELEARHRGGGS